MRIAGAGLERLGAALLQVTLTFFEQARGDVVPAIGGNDAEDAGNADGAGVGGRTGKGGVREADELVVLLGEDEAGGVEGRLGEDELFEGGAVLQRHRAAPREDGIPQFDEARRIRIAKGAKGYHRLSL
ncbi:MAG: hypothetical protein U0793_26580 [Gemmataceae bacterium]